MNDAFDVTDYFILVPLTRDLYCPAVKGTLEDTKTEAKARAAENKTGYAVLAHRAGGRFRIDTYTVAEVNRDGEVKAVNLV